MVCKLLKKIKGTLNCHIITPNQFRDINLSVKDFTLCTFCNVAVLCLHHLESFFSSSIYSQHTIIIKLKQSSGKSKNG